MRSTLTSKGQVTIPQAIREKLGLKPGDFVSFSLGEKNEVILRPPGRLEDLFGMLGKPPNGRHYTIEEMNELVPRAVAEDVMRAFAPEPRKKPRRKRRPPRA